MKCLYHTIGIVSRQVHIFEAQAIGFVFIPAAVGGEDQRHQDIRAQGRDPLGLLFHWHAFKDNGADQIVTKGRLKFLDRMAGRAVADLMRQDRTQLVVGLQPIQKPRKDIDISAGCREGIELVFLNQEKTVLIILAVRNLRDAGTDSFQTFKLRLIRGQSKFPQKLSVDIFSHEDFFAGWNHDDFPSAGGGVVGAK